MRSIPQRSEPFVARLVSRLVHPRSRSVLLALLDSVSLPPQADVLLLGDSARPLMPELNARAYRVREALASDGAARSQPSADPKEVVDVVIAAGYLERQRWDRWALRQIHGRIRDGGHLLLAAANLYSPLLLADPRYLAAKLRKQLPKLLRRIGIGVPVTQVRERQRSYDARRLRAMLEDLGFEIVRWSERPPWPLQVLAGHGSRLATHHLVLARKRPSIFGLQPGRPFPDPVQHGIRFREDFQDLLRIREAWVRRHSPPAAELEALEVRRYAGESVLVLAPHPDDEIIGCGGTLSRLAGAGARVVVLHATDGSASVALEDEPETLRRIVRLDEAITVSRLAGFAEPILWRADNRTFAFRPELAQRLRGTLADLRPALIFTPFIADLHADHLTLNLILAAALDGAPPSGARVIGYEVWSLVPPNLHCEITSFMPQLERLLLLYETAMKVDDFVHMCAMRNYQHGLSLTGRPGFVEAFHAVSAEDYPAWIAQARGGACPAA